MPNIRLWKSQKLTQQTKVYHDESIDNVGGLLKEGVRKAKIAHLLSPNNKEIEEKLLDVALQGRTSQSSHGMV